MRDSKCPHYSKCVENIEQLRERDAVIRQLVGALENLSLYVSYEGDRWVEEKSRKTLAALAPRLREWGLE